VLGNSEFPEGVQGIGDVLSHIGTSVQLDYGGKKLNVSLIQNPSHLEVKITTKFPRVFTTKLQAVDPVVMGKTRAKQTKHGDHEREKVMCLMLHGDASFYGQVHEQVFLSADQTQGTVAETLGFSKLNEFTVG
jgi:2-oxoglutarate dehydrogenase E1 component